MTFSGNDIEQIETALNTKAKLFENSWYFQLSRQDTKDGNQNSLGITIYNSVRLSSSSDGSLVTAQTKHGYFEIHNCTGFVKVEPDEIIFVSENGNVLSCLVVGASCTCSMFSNVNKEILKGDFSKLDPAVLMSAMQLSFAEQLL